MDNLQTKLAILKAKLALVRREKHNINHRIKQVIAETIEDWRPGQLVDIYLQKNKLIIETQNKSFANELMYKKARLLAVAEELKGINEVVIK